LEIRELILLAEYYFHIKMNNHITDLRFKKENIHTTKKNILKKFSGKK
jgi:hypothetical protein